MTPLGQLTPDQQDAADKRAALVEGLRDAAAWIEAHGEIPTPTWASISFYADWYRHPLTPSEFAAAARVLGPVVKCKVPLDSLRTERVFGPVRVTVTAPGVMVGEPREVTTTEYVMPTAKGEEPAGNWTADQLGLTGERAA